MSSDKRESPANIAERLLREHLHFDVEGFGGMTLADLGLDSLTLVEWLVRCETLIGEPVDLRLLADFKDGQAQVSDVVDCFFGES